MPMQRRRIRRFRKEPRDQQLSAADRSALNHSKHTFFLIIMIGIVCIALAIGIAIPIVQSASHNTFVSRTIDEALRLADTIDEPNEYPESGNIENFNTFYIACIDSESFDGEADSISDDAFLWEVGNEKLMEFVHASPAKVATAVETGWASSDSYGLKGKISKEGDILIAGIDNSEFNSYFVTSTIALEVLLLAAICIFALLTGWLARKIFEPVVESMIAQRKFVGDASHELKTPLAVIRADADILMSGKDHTDPEAKWIASIQAQADRMSTTIKDLVTISSLESSFHLHKVENMSQLIDDVSLSFDAVCFEKGVYYSVVRLDPGVRVECSAEDTRKLLEELFGNAVKYAEGNPPRIEVSFELRKTCAVLSITNTGCTIAPEEKERVFDRFYRTASMRAQGKAGSGLGLSICRSICEKNKFKITCEPVMGDHTTFKVVMPLA